MQKKILFLNLLIVLIVFLITIEIPDSFAYLMEKTILEQYQENEIILIGNVTSLSENSIEGFTEYVIKVEKFIKNPQKSYTLNVIGLGAKSSDIHISLEQIYEKNTRVFLFLNETDGILRISPYSFSALNFNPDQDFILPPLKLHHGGISIDDIVCRGNLELVIKANDKSPACVSLNTKVKLMERGWMQ